MGKEKLQMANKLTPEKRREWVEKHDHGFTASVNRGTMFKGLIYKEEKLEPEEQDLDKIETCRIRAVDKHGWGYRRL